MSRVKEEPAPRRRSGGGIVIGERAPRAPSPPRGSLRLVRPKREPGSPASKKAKRWEDARREAERQAAALTEYERRQEQLRSAEDPKYEPGLAKALADSYNDVPPAAEDFAYRWSKEDYARQESERARRRGAFVDLTANDDEAGPSAPAAGSSKGKQPKEEPPFPDYDDEDEDDDEVDYATAMYRRFGM